MLVWRCCHSTRVASAFTGAGAHASGGRWNSPGTSLVYCAEHPALAAMEMLVHLHDIDALREQYVLIPVEFDAALAAAPGKPLPKNWDSDSARLALRAIGDAWVAAASPTPVLIVPSVLLPRCDNYLINPKHADFAKLQIGKPVPFAYDPRITPSKP